MVSNVSEWCKKKKDWTKDLLGGNGRAKKKKKLKICDGERGWKKNG